MITAPNRTTMNGKPVFHVPVKTVLNLNSGFKEKLLCDGPALSLGDACAYSCSFCYVPSVYQKLDRVRTLLAEKGLKHEDVVIVREGGLEVLRAQLVNPDGKPRFLTGDDVRVVYTSPADDVAANMDLLRATFEACKLILTTTNWQIRLLSKSTRLPRLAGMLLDWSDSTMQNGPLNWVSPGAVQRRTIWGVSTGTLDDDVANAIEEGTPNVSKRIESLRVLQDNGLRTFAMVCPSLPCMSHASYAEFAELAREVLRYDRCEHVWAEVINLRGASFTRTLARLRAAGFEGRAELLEHITNDPEAWENYNRFTFLAHAKVCAPFVGKLRFLTYVKPSTRGWWEKHIASGAVLLGGHNAS